MRICLTTKYSPADWRGGGMSIAVHNTAKALVNKGYNVGVVYTYSGNKPPLFDTNYNIYWVKQECIGDYLIKVPKLIKRLIKKERFDIIHSNGPEGAFIPNILKDNHFVVTSHQALIYNLGEWNFIKDFFKKKFYYPWKSWIRFELEMERIACLKSEKIITVSNYFKNKISKKYNISRKKIITIYNGADTNKFNYSFNEYEGKINLIFVGRLSPVKGLDLLINTYKKLTTKYNNLFLTVVGEGKYEKVYKNICQKQNLSRVRFIKYLSQENLIKVIHKSHILIVPSYTENCPLIVLEGMSAGIPIIASGVGGIPELIKSGKNGLLFNPLNPDSLYKSIELLIKNKKLREDLSVKARENVEENFSWDKNSEMLIKVYENVTKKK